MQSIIRQMLIAVVVLVVITVVVQIVSNSPAVQNLIPTPTPWPTSFIVRSTSPTDSPPGITIRPQKLTGGNTVIVTWVSAGVPGWVSIHADASNRPASPVLGYVAVPRGISNNLAVRLNTSKLTPQLWALLHVDKGQIGVFEYPGPDDLVYTAGKNFLSAHFVLTK